MRKEELVVITTIIRISDKKHFKLGDTATVGGSFVGVINAMHQFEDDFRVHLDVHHESGDPEYWSITELD